MNKKTNVFGLNASVALAALTMCGSTLFVSCYEDAELVGTGAGPAKYFILGTVTDASTGAPLTDFKVTVDGTAVTPNGSTYYYELPAAPSKEVGTYQVNVTKSGYIDVTRGVLVVKVGAGQISTGNGDVAMLHSDNVNVETGDKIADASVDDQAVRDDVAKNVGLKKDAVTSYPNGQKDPFDLQVTSYSGVVVDKSRTEVKVNGEVVPSTRALAVSNYIDMAYRNVEAVLKQNIVDQFVEVSTTQTIYPVAGNPVYGVHIDYSWIIHTYAYEYKIEEGKTVQVSLTVAYMQNVTLRPMYNAHDVHDLQDAINGGQGGGGGVGGNVAI